MPTLLRIDWWSMETGYNSFHLLKANVRESERRRRGDEIELLMAVICKNPDRLKFQSEKDGKGKGQRRKNCISKIW
ncbi:unnamed protein product [Onchocerca flexuosa]|uniref:Uncharacterized protein n=1 Tax=Onchocerca flexuosa TaxID=387005 RepID=A0A183H1Z9_9BILA|nr:unnamed protein product [Onchocerca flexuosa]